MHESNIFLKVAVIVGTGLSLAAMIPCQHNAAYGQNGPQQAGKDKPMTTIETFSAKGTIRGCYSKWYERIFRQSG